MFQKANLVGWPDQAVVLLSFCSAATTEEETSSRPMGQYREPSITLVVDLLADTPGRCSCYARLWLQPSVTAVTGHAGL